MGENSKIEWTDHTFNPWHGCAHRTLGDRVHPGCEHCYAERQAKRNPGVLGTWGDEGTRILASADKWKLPAKWNAWAREGICLRCRGRRTIPLFGLTDFTVEQCPGCNGTGRVEPYRAKVFCASIADVFEGRAHDYVHDAQGRLLLRPYLDRETTIDSLDHFDGTLEECRHDPQGWHPLTLHDVRRWLFELIDATPFLDWQILTKRPENVLEMWPARADYAYVAEAGSLNDYPMNRRDNVWLGTSISDQATADALVPELLRCRNLCPVLFLSAEPLVGPVDLIRCDAIRVDEHPHRENWPHEHRADVHWVIAGGESGGQARPCHPDWIRSLRDQCAVGGVPFFFKQWGEWLPWGGRIPASDSRRINDVGLDITSAPELWCGDEHVTDAYVYRVGKAKAGRELDGVTHDAFPGAEVTA